jgi:serine/threonine protein kinase
MTHYADPPDVPNVTGLSRIGGGGFGTVYRGEQTGLGRTVAVKVLNIEQLDRKALRGFEREAKLMTKLSSHPNVPDVYWYGVLADRRPCLVFQFCRNGALRSDVALPAPRVVEIGAKVGAVLALAHKENIVHRDVKPGNILIADNNEPMLSDFGLSLQPNQDQSIGIDAFAPPYAAPEVLEASDVESRAADVYSLGATLFALLTGGPPFPRRAGESVLAWISRVKATPMPALPEGTPRQVEELLRQMLAKQPGERPSALDVAHRFSRLLRDWWDYQRQQMAAPLDPTTKRTTFAAAGQAVTPVAAVQYHDGDLSSDKTGIRAPESRPAQPPARREVKWRPILIISGAVVAVLTVSGVAYGLWPQPTPSPQTLPTTVSSVKVVTASPGTAKITLAAAKDQGTYVELQWTGPSELQYVVVVAEVGKPEDYRIVNRVTTARIDVAPAAQLCFRIQGVNAAGVQGQSNVVSIRGAVCRFD